jgi:hypothetical protein
VCGARLGRRRGSRFWNREGTVEAEGKRGGKRKVSFKENTEERKNTHVNQVEHGVFEDCTVEYGGELVLQRWEVFVSNSSIDRKRRKKERTVIPV